MIAAFHKEHPAVPLAQLCTWAGISRSWFYKRPATLLPCEEATVLRDAIERIVLEFPGYGYRRVTAALHQQGTGVNHKRVLRVMRKESLLCVLKKRFVATTDSRHGERVYPNRLKEMTLTKINEAWVSDITYIRLPSGFCYLAAILDAFSRRCVGWSLSKDINTRLCLEALEKALWALPACGFGASLGSGRPVREWRVCGAVRGCRSFAQYVREGQPVRQCQGGEFLQDAEARGGVSEGLSNSGRGTGAGRCIYRMCL